MTGEKPVFGKKTDRDDRGKTVFVRGGGGQIEIPRRCVKANAFLLVCFSWTCIFGGVNQKSKLLDWCKPSKTTKILEVLNNEYVREAKIEIPRRCVKAKAFLLVCFS